MVAAHGCIVASYGSSRLHSTSNIPQSAAIPLALLITTIYLFYFLIQEKIAESSAKETLTMNA